MARIHPHPLVNETREDKPTETERRAEEAAAKNDPAARHDPTAPTDPAARNDPATHNDPIARTEINEPLEEELRTPTVRGPVFWWTVGLMLFAAFVALLWLGNDLQVFG